MDKLKEKSGEGSGRSGVGDYFVVVSAQSSWMVSTAMARAIDATLHAWPEARWVTFVDLTGSRVRLRARQIEYLAQCTVEQRSAERSLHQGLKREYRSDRSWDE
jgi:hypothetical protein